MNYFEQLNIIDVSSKVEKKNGLSYLSWAWAWGELKKRFPSANYKVYETESGVNYFTDGKTCWTKVGVTVGDIEHVEYLPVMDFKNRSIPLEQVTSFDVNKAIQRGLTKAIARHGLGLYIYAGEDLPEAPKPICSECGGDIVAVGTVSAEQMATATTQKYGRPICKACCDRALARKKLEEQKEIPVEVIDDAEGTK